MNAWIRKMEVWVVISSCLLATTWADVLDERKWRQGYAGDLV